MYLVYRKYKERYKFLLVQHFVFIPLTWRSPGVHESSLPVAHPGYQVLSDIFQTWPDSECSHIVQFLDSAWTHWAVYTCFGTVWPFWCWWAVKLWYNHHHHHHHHHHHITIPQMLTSMSVILTYSYFLRCIYQSWRTSYICSYVDSFWVIWY